MEGLFFNADDGYLEGIVRGYRGNILTNSAYINLTQCETLEGRTRSQPNHALTPYAPLPPIPPPPLPPLLPPID